MTYTEFKAEIKKGLPNTLYIFTGPEDFLKDYCAGAAKKRLVDPSLEDFNFQCYTTVPDMSLCIDFINAIPMMSERKLLVFRKCGFFERSLKQRTEWEKIFTSLPPFICVILWETEDKKTKKSKKEPDPPLLKACKTVGTVVEFQYQTETMLMTWLAKAAASEGKLIDRACASHLIASVGRSMSVLKTEMQKICAHTAEKQITRADIDAVVVPPIEDKTFELIGAIVGGRRDLSFQYLYDLKLSRTEPTALLSTLSSRILTVYRAKLLLGEGLYGDVVAKRIGGHPYYAKKCVDEAKKASEEGLENLIGLCRDADRNIKNGQMDPETALEIIVSEAKVF